MAKLVSILMAVKSGWQYVPEAIDSILRQTYAHWEVLLGINGLGPNSEPHRYVDSKTPKLGPQGQVLQVLDLPGCRNKPQTLNTMRNLSAGDYIAVLDADDRWQSKKLEMQMPLLFDGWDVVGTGAEYFGDQEGVIEIASGHITFEHLLECNHIVNSSVVVRREMGPWPDTDGLDDYEMWLNLARQGRTIFNLPDRLTMIRCHAGQWFSGKIDNSEEIRAKYRRGAQT